MTKHARIIALLTAVALGLLLVGLELVIVPTVAPYTPIAAPGVYDVGPWPFPPVVSDLYPPIAAPMPAYSVDTNGNLVSQTDDQWIGTSADTNIMFDDAGEDMTLSIGPRSDLLFEESASAVAIALGYPGNIIGLNANLDNYVNPQAYSAIALWGRGNEVRATGVGYQTIINGYSNIVHNTGNIFSGSNNHARRMGEGGVLFGEQNDGFGEESLIVGGNENLITATVAGDLEATIVGGYQNVCRGNNPQRCFIGGGGDNQGIEAAYLTIGGGLSNTVVYTYGTVAGGYGAWASHYAEMAHASGFFAAGGDAQRSEFVVRRPVVHSGATWYTLFLDGASELLTIPEDGLWNANVQLVGLTSGAAQQFAYNLQCSVVNDGGTTSLLSTNTDTLAESDANYDARCTGNNSADSLDIQVQNNGGTAYTIRWVATVRVVQVTR